MTRPSSYITLLTNESYLPGTLTLGMKLKRDHKTKHGLAILLNTAAFSPKSIELIEEVYDDIIPIDDIEVFGPGNGLVHKLGREELSVTFNKLLLWNQTNYDSLLYIDSDALPLKNLDHLFEKHKSMKSHQVAASPDSGWPDIFNSGVLLLKPDAKTFAKLLDFSKSENSTFDGADQGLLNEFFNVSSGSSNWIRLPFLYNVTPTPSYQYVPAFMRFFGDVYILHYIGSLKPWKLSSYITNDYSNLWWENFNKFYPDPAVRAKILSHERGEAFRLSFEKTQSVWDDPGVSEIKPATPEVRATSIFPWEDREERLPTRVFEPIITVAHTGPKKNKLIKRNEKNIESISALKISNEKPVSELTKNFDDSNSDFDPSESLKKVSKLPLKMLNKRK